MILNYYISLQRCVMFGINVSFILNYILIFSKDTFLLLDALEKDKEFILSIKPQFCLEIGYAKQITA